MKSVLLWTTVMILGASAFASDFTNEELRSALGKHYEQAMQEGWLSLYLDPYAAEDGTKWMPEPEGYRQILKSNESAPVWKPFINNLKGCAPGCVPAVIGVYRGGRPSCHNTGRAVDVGMIVCGGKKHTAMANGRFASMVKCMKGKMRVLYRNKDPKRYGVTEAHYDHGHFSIGCTVSGGRRYWGDDGAVRE